MLKIQQMFPKDIIRISTDVGITTVAEIDNKQQPISADVGLLTLAEFNKKQ